MKINKLIDNFILSVEYYFDECNVETTAKHIAVSYVQLFRPPELQNFITKFVIRKGIIIGIVRDNKDIKISLINFINQIIDETPTWVKISYNDNFKFLNDIFLNPEHEFYADVEKHFGTSGALDLLSFSEIIERKYYKLTSINTLKKYINELDIRVYTFNDVQGKYIKDYDLKYILQHIAK